MSATPSRPFAGQKVLVQGLGNFGGGVGVARWLAGQGACVTVTDMAPAEKLGESIAALADAPVQLKLGGHEISDFTSCDLLVVNPAVHRAKSAYVQAAIGAGIPITTEMNLFVQRCRGLTIGITGSVGKSTTTALIHHALAAGIKDWAVAGGPQVFLGGNIGKSLLPELDRIGPRDIVVLELSSFMLEDTPAIRWSPNIAVITNLSPNHLDRHGTLAAYQAAKQNILAFQQPGDTAIFNSDHPAVRDWAALARGKVREFTTRDLPTLRMMMPGEHNQSNARAALAVLDVLPLGLNKAAALQAIQEFPGLAHRLQCVHTSRQPLADGRTVEVRWFNDSKATTPEAALTALRAFPKGSVICIVGGYDKHIDDSEFIKALADRAAGVVGIGQTGSAMVAAVNSVQSAGGPSAMYVETLDRAVATARQWAAELAARPGHPPDEPMIVLLSPACASWGQFQNYERRGEYFTELARGREKA